MGETSPCAAASTAVAVLTGSDIASHNAAADRTATNTPTTPTRLRLNRLEVIGECDQFTTGRIHLPLGRSGAAGCSTRLGHAYVVDVSELERFQGRRELVPIADDDGQQ